MTAKEFLYTIRDEKSEIEEIQDRISSIRASLLPKGIRYDTPRVQTSPADSMADKMNQVIEYEKMLEERVKELCKKRVKAQRMIDALEDTKERQVLNLYFLSERRLRMQEVSEQIGYSESRTYDIYNAALGHLPDIEET